MKMKFFLAAVALFSFSASAQETNKTTASAESVALTESTNEDPQGWIPFASLGASAVEFDETLAGEDGFGGNARIIASYYKLSKSLVFDMGVGFEAAEFNDDTLHSGLGELAARMRFGKTKKWSFGPVANFNFGSDVGLNYGSTNDDIATFAGAQLMRDFAAGKTMMVRAGLKALTDVGIHNATANKYLFELQFGMAGAPTQVSENHKEIVKQASAVTAPESSVIVAEPETQKIMVPTSIYFTTNANTFGPRNQRVVGKLAEILKANKQDIKSIHVTGYADSRGEEAFNKTLSEERAKSVMTALEQAGISPLDYQMTGAGEQSDEDLKRARRVDLELTTVKGVNWLNQMNGLYKIK